MLKSSKDELKHEKPRTRFTQINLRQLIEAERGVVAIVALELDLLLAARNEHLKIGSKYKAMKDAAKNHGYLVQQLLAHLQHDRVAHAVVDVGADVGERARLQQ